MAGLYGKPSATTSCVTHATRYRPNDVGAAPLRLRSSTENSAARHVRLSALRPARGGGGGVV